MYNKKINELTNNGVKEMIFKWYLTVFVLIHIFILMQTKKIYNNNKTKRCQIHWGHLNLPLEMMTVMRQISFLMELINAFYGVIFLIIIVQVEIDVVLFIIIT